MLSSKYQKLEDEKKSSKPVIITSSTKLSEQERIVNCSQCRRRIGFSSFHISKYTLHLTNTPWSSIVCPNCNYDIYVKL